jgi:hypothetical protein
MFAGGRSEPRQGKQGWWQRTWFAMSLFRPARRGGNAMVDVMIPIAFTCVFGQVCV